MPATSHARPGLFAPVRRWYESRRESWRTTFVGELVVRAIDLQLVSRATVLSTQQVACLAPLAVGILAMQHPGHRANVGRELARLFGLDDQAAWSVTSLFTSSEHVATATGLIGILLLVGWAAGVPAYQQRIVADIWQTETKGFHQLLTARLIWLASFGGLTAVLGLAISLSWHAHLPSGVVLVIWSAAAFVIQWITDYLLLGRAVPIRHLVLAAVLTVMLQALLLVALHIWGSTIINQAVDQFGLVGITFLVQAAAVFVAGAMVLGELLAAEWYSRGRRDDGVPPSRIADGL